MLNKSDWKIDIRMLLSDLHKQVYKSKTTCVRINSHALKNTVQKALYLFPMIKKSILIEFRIEVIF